MNLIFNTELAAGYHSKSQIARVLTEDWISRNMFCPQCGYSRIQHFENNRPVADFFCPNCLAQYELKSKDGKISDKVADGAYKTMITRITSNENPEFFFLSYSLQDFSVKNLVMVPKHFFVPSIIEKRKPLASTARRAGWVGCNILLNKIPIQGRISIITDGHEEEKSLVVKKANMARRLNVDSIENRGWLFDILNCVNAIDSKEFTLADIYEFENLLADMHPANKNIRPKIRQQLQMLRDRGFIDFLGNGNYVKKE